MSIFRELGIRDGKDRINEEVVYNIAKAYNTIDSAITEILNEFNLSPAKFNILLMVKHVGKNKGLPQNEISKLLLVTTSNITRMIDKLEKEELVKREATEGDRRVKTIKITQKGSSLLDKAWIPYKTVIDKKIDKTFSNAEKRKINSLIARV